MKLLVLGLDSRFAAEALALEADGRARLVVAGKGPLEVTTGPDDQAVVGSSVASFYLKDLLRRCREGRLGDVRLLVDGAVPAAERVGFRERPWLAEVLLPVGAALPWAGPLPAAVRELDSLADLLERWPKPRVRFAPVPSEFPAELQVETTTTCRAGCAFCPRPRLDTGDQLMDEELFAAIVEQCGEGRPDNLELYLNGEPLDDPRLERLATLAKTASPSSLVSITTHVDALGEARAESLAASGLDLVFASLNPLGGLDDGWLVPRLERLAGVARVLDQAGKRLVVVSLVNLIPQGCRGRYRRLLAGHGLPFEAFTATSRAGDVDLARFAAPGPAPTPSVCERVFTRAFVRCDGEVVLCCEDFRHRRCLGSLRRQTLAEIWVSQAYQQARRELLERRPQPPCDRCERGRS